MSRNQRTAEISTKGVLSVISGVHDPFGIISLVVVELKDYDLGTLANGVWLGQYFTRNTGKRFTEHFQDLQQEKLTILRQFVQIESRYNINLHSFTDVSKKARAVVCYGQTEKNGQTSVFLIASKT